MKTIEEKAKRYDEILARATGAYLPYYTEDIMTKVREFVEHLIPELKESEESEDERIKKAIKYGLDYVFTNNTTVYETTKEQCLAWLEKQGEQKPADKVEPKFKVGNKIYLKPEYRMPNDDTPIANTVFEIRAIDDKHYRFDSSYIFIEDQDKYELVEQKPTEWSEEDENQYINIIGLVKNANDCAGILDKETALNWLKSIKGRFTWKPSKEQKPLFPDNEVRDIWEYIAQFKTLYGHYPNDADEIEVIVREVIKSKSEWNKRDEEILDTIISVFTHRYADDSEDERDISSWEIVRWAEKLKSRRLKSEWKPSEERLNALRVAIGDEQGSDCCGALRDLLKDLKSL